MSSSAGVNVLRYSALGLGVFYGFYHQRSITTTQRKAAAQREYARKEKLIEQARAEYNKSKQPLGAPSSTSGGLKLDPTSANFDLEAYITAST